MRLRRFERSVIVKSTSAEIFDFFADPQNLPRLTPPSYRFEFVEPPPATLEAGAIVVYRVRLFGVPVRCRSRIESWEPPVQFITLLTVTVPLPLSVEAMSRFCTDRLASHVTGPPLIL